VLSSASAAAGSALSSTPELIRQTVERLQQDVPALAKLKLVVGLELRGRGDIQHFRVEIPGPKISKSFGEDERLHISIPRSHFNELAADGGPKHWREAYEQGHIKVEGDPNVQKLIGKVIGQAEARSHLRKAR
jgi:hypothetical protein